MKSFTLNVPQTPTPAFVPPVNNDLLQIAYASWRYSLFLDQIVSEGWQFRQAEGSDISDSVAALDASFNSIVSDLQTAMYIAIGGGGGN